MLSDKEVEEMIRIANADIKMVETKRHWYTLGFPIKHYIHYSLREQLGAIKKLGESESPRALSFLEDLLTSEDTGCKQGGSTSFGDETNIIHPYARGELSAALQYYHSPPGNAYGYSKQEDPEAIATLETALRKLKSK